MAGELFDVLVFLIVVLIVAGLILFAVKRFFADVYPAARLIVGGLALIAILIKLKPLILKVLS